MLLDCLEEVLQDCQHIRLDAREANILRVEDLHSFRLVTGQPVEYLREDLQLAGPLICFSPLSLLLAGLMLAEWGSGLDWADCPFGFVSICVGLGVGGSILAEERAFGSD